MFVDEVWRGEMRLTEEELERLAAHAAPARWPAGFAVYQRGAAADGVFVVVSGSIVLRTRLKGGRAFVPALLTPGALFGIEGLSAGGLYQTDARAVSESQTLHLSRERVRTLLRERPHDAASLMAQIAASHGEVLDRLRELAMMSVEQRLHAALERARLARDDQNGEPLTFDPAGYRLLCEMVGATRESVSLVVNRLVAEGVAVRDGNNVTITGDPRGRTPFAALAVDRSVRSSRESQAAV